MAWDKQSKTLIIIKSTLSRLPIYYGYLLEKQKAGEEYVSSAVIAESLSLNPVQVRKDLASVSSVPGRPRKGFQTEQLIADVRRYLGYDNYDEAVLVGVGNLGMALLRYEGFSHCGVNIVAAFDANPVLVGVNVNGKTVMDLSKLESFVQRLHTNIGIITVPDPAAQHIADILVAAGVKAIWNFSSVMLKLPKGILVKNESLAASLSAIARELKTQEALMQE